MAKAIVLITSNPGVDREVAGQVKKIEGVENVYLAAGRFDIVAEVQTPDDASTNELVHNFFIIGCHIPHINPNTNPTIPEINKYNATFFRGRLDLINSPAKIPDKVVAVNPNPVSSQVY